MLAEAYSGKTEEFRHQCETLNADGKPAFFLRIEDLDQGTEQALDRESTERFRAWLTAPGEAWFFLDSVDEARLNRKNFETALRRFAKDIGDASERAHIYVSCRVTDWRGADDRALFLRYLPAWKSPESDHSTPAGNLSGLLGPIFDQEESAQRRAPNQNEENLESLAVVQLVPLSEEQCAELAKAAAVKDIAAFTATINRQGLSTLTERPGDLLDLADYWNANGNFGPFAKMVEHSVRRKLAEPNPFRPDNEALSQEDAFWGAERLAAALTLGKSFTLRAPGNEADPSLAAGALDPAQILPEWTPAKRNALLRRGLFAPATYGRIRFHHRSSQEYLTAKWLHRLVRAGCSHAEIFNLIFAERYGVDTVVPSLRVVAAWLALWHTEIRQELTNREPLILLGYGDPGSLPSEAREQILLAYASKQASGETADDRLENRDLWMFATEQLAPAILKAASINKRDDFRFDLLRLIREGAIKGAVSLARSIALDQKANDHHRIVAVDALEACGDEATMAKIARRFLKSPAAASARLASSLSATFYPKHLGTHDLLKIIRSAKSAGPYSSDGFGYYLKDFYAKAPNNAARAALLRGLSDLCLSKPFIDQFRRTSARYVDLTRHMVGLADLELQRIQGAVHPDYVIRMLMVVERSGRDGSRDEPKQRLAERIRANASLNRGLMWADVAEQRANSSRYGAVTRHWQVLVGANSRLWGLAERDLPWLFDDLRTKPDLEDRQVALSCLFEVLGQSGQLIAQAPQLRAATGAETVLLAELADALAPQPAPALNRTHALQMAFYDLQGRYQRVKDKESWIAFRQEVLANPKLLRDPKLLSSWRKGIFRLRTLQRWLQYRTGSDEGNVALQWRLLEEGFSREVAEAFRDGMKILWRLVRPVRPIKKPGGTINIKWPSLLAFAAVGLEAANDADWPANLSEKEMALAARHGCRAEQSYPDWIDLLTIASPKAVLPVIREQIEFEWSAPGNLSTTFLHRYGGAATSIQKPVQRLIFDVIVAAEASAAHTINIAQGIVQRLELDAKQKARLFSIARKRFDGYAKAGKNDWTLCYLGLLLIVDPDQGVSILETWLNATPAADRKARAEQTFGTLFDRYDVLVAGSFAAASTETLERLLRVAYTSIRPKDDVMREGTYTPDTRDHAQNARDATLGILLARPGPDAYYAMQRLAENSALALRAHRFRELARGKATRDAELPAWTAEEVRSFETTFLAPAKTGADLLRIVLGVLADIQWSLSTDDFSSRALLERAKDEEEVQQWLAEQLHFRAKGRFQITRESEIALGDKPDITVSSTSAPYQVAVEVKHGGKGWTGAELENALRVQLAEDYLKPDYRRHGVLVITHHYSRHWQRPNQSKKITFAELIAWLSSIAVSIKQNAVGPIVVACVGLNAWKGEPAAAPKRPTAAARTGAKRRTGAKTPKTKTKKALKRKASRGSKTGRSAARRRVAGASRLNRRQR
ncbi:hypothetical protein [Bradyrhizobium sp. HKCCYLS3013]|uniref:hypothetical protein n=1 Tax=Bradyrhizobium sp. HKCCYLS3013 TaxID=3420735 RepID=UPI003EBC33FB